MKYGFILLVTLLSFTTNIHAQTMICWKVEIVALNNNTNSFDVKNKMDINSEAYFSNTRIRVNDIELYLNIKSTQSITKSREGQVAIYNTVSDFGEKMSATVVSDSNGIFKLFVIGDGSASGLVFYLKNR